MPKKIASARPRSRSSNVCTTIASAAGNMIAPPAPCTIRNVTIQASASDALRGQPAHRRGSREHDHAERHHLAVPDRVGQAPAEGEQRGQRQQVGVDRPLRAGARQAELLLDFGRGDRDDRLVDEGHRHGEDHRRENQVPRSSADRCAARRIAAPKLWARLDRQRAGRQAGRLCSQTAAPAPSAPRSRTWLAIADGGVFVTQKAEFGLDRSTATRTARGQGDVGERSSHACDRRPRP